MNCISSVFHAIAHRLSSTSEKAPKGNFQFPGMLIKASNSTVYRFDARPPEIILKEGFSGTLSDNADGLRVFGKKTVFTAPTVEKANTFLQLDAHAGKPNTLYLYKITLQNHESFSFTENYSRNKEAMITATARNLLRGELGSSMGSLNPSNQMKMLKPIAESSLKEAYLAADELQINGPILPDHITFIDSSPSPQT